MISNVAMSEQDLYPNGVNEYKYIDSEEAITFGNSVVDGCMLMTVVHGLVYCLRLIPKATRDFIS